MEAVLNLSMILFLTAVTAAAAFWCLLEYFYIPRHASDEPPVVPSSIPILGLLLHGMRYYQTTRCVPTMFLAGRESQHTSGQCQMQAPDIYPEYAQWQGLCCHSSQSGQCRQPELQSLGIQSNLENVSPAMMKPQVG